MNDQSLFSNFMNKVYKHHIYDDITEAYCTFHREAGFYGVTFTKQLKLLARQPTPIS